MSAMFRRPKVSVPQAPEPAPVPTIDDAARNLTETRRIRARRGMAGNVMTGPMGLAVPAQNLGQKTLTGG
jgi:hypothetical protein